jgi:hypothetical protein
MLAIDSPIYVLAQKGASLPLFSLFKKGVYSCKPIPVAARSNA